MPAVHNYVNPFSPYLSWEARLVALISYVAMTVILIFIVNKACTVAPASNANDD